MDYLTRKLKINNWNDVTYFIHTKQEADDRELEYVHWKKAQKGDLAISDDNYVAECVQRKKYKDAEQVTMPYGRMWISDKAKLLYEPHRNTGEYSQCGTLTWEERESRTTRTKNAVKLYVQMMMQTGKIDWTVLGKAYRPDQFKPDATVKRLFKTEQVKGMVDKKIQEYLDERELNQGDVLDVIADAITIARNNADPSNMLRGAEQYIRIMDMLPSKTQITDSVQIDVTKKILDEISTEESRQLKLERTQDDV
jgi:hypothetical protein